MNYGLLTCIRDDIQINATRNYNNSKVELSVVDMYFKKSICLMNIYAAPFEQVQRITETIQKAKSESMNSNSIIIIAGDFNVDMQSNIRGNLGSKMGLIRKRAKISFCELEFKNQ